MNFQQTHILWFLFLLLIPLIIHLVDFQRTRVLAFPGVYRLIQRIQVAQQQRKLQNWLIWLCRTLALLCVIMAFALPTCNNQNGNKNGFDRYVLVVDNSLSSAVKDDNGISFETMRAEIQQFLQGLPTDQLVCLITQSSDDLSGWLTAQEVSTMIDTLTCSVQYTGWKQWKLQVEKAIKLGESNFNVIRGRTKVLVFTDLEQSTATGLAGFGLETQKSKGDTSDSVNSNKSNVGNNGINLEEWQIVRYPLAKINHVCIDSAYSNGGEDSATGPSVKVRLKNYSSKESSVSISLKSLGKVAGNKQLVMPADGIAIVEFPITFTEVKENQEKDKSQIEGQGFVVEKDEDDFPWDDKLYLHTVPQWKLKIGILGRNTQLERMFSVQKSMEISLINEQITQKSLEGFHSIIIIGVDGFNTSETAAIKDFMDAGGVVFQCFNDAPNLGSFTLSTPFGLLKCKNKVDEFRIEKAGFSNPIFRNAFRDLPDDGTSTPVFSHSVELMEDGDFNPVLVGENGVDLLLQKNWGAGSYWLWSNALSKGSEGWMKSSWSLPIFSEIISINNKKDFPLFGLVKTSGIVQLPGLQPTKERSVSISYLGTDFYNQLSQNGVMSWIKEWQEDMLGIGGVYWGGDPSLPGFYNVRSNGKGRLLAMNIGRTESSMKEIDDLELVFQRLGIMNFEEVEPGTLRQATDKSNSQKTWMYFLWFSIIFLLLEVVLHWSKNKSVK